MLEKPRLFVQFDRKFECTRIIGLNRATFWTFWIMTFSPPSLPSLSLSLSLPLAPPVSSVFLCCIFSLLPPSLSFFFPLPTLIVAPSSFPLPLLPPPLPLPLPPFSFFFPLSTLSVQSLKILKKYIFITCNKLCGLLRFESSWIFSHNVNAYSSTYGVHRKVIKGDDCWRDRNQHWRKKI